MHSEMLVHITAKHIQDTLNIKKSTTLNATDGTLHTVSKSYHVTTLQIEEKGESLIFDKSKNEVLCVCTTVTTVSQSSSLLKKSKRNIPPQSFDDMYLDDEKCFIDSIFPDVIKTAYKSGFLEELVQFHRVLANGIFPIEILIMLFI